MKIKSIIKLILLLNVFFLTVNYSFSQQYNDTLGIVNDLRSQNKYDEASSLLKDYIDHHPDDVDALWLYAQTNFWLGNNEEADFYYNKALSLDPENDYLNIDYARTLANMGEWEKSISILNKLKAGGKDYSDADFIRAKIFYWKNDFDISEDLLNNVLYKDGNNSDAYALLIEVLRAKSPWLKLNTSASFDNQPLDNQNLSFEFGKYVSSALNPFIGIYFPFYNNYGGSSNAYWLQAGIKSFFPEIKFYTQVEAGVFKYPDKPKTDWTASVNLKKIFGNYLVTDLKAEHSPYLNTVSSLDTNLSYYNFSASLAWDDQNSVISKSGYLFSLFPHSKYVYAAYFWIYTPPVKFSGFEIRPGYSFNYSNSNTNTFVAVNSSDQIISGNNNRYIDGIYDPYFTPKDQMINSGMLSIKYTPSNILNFGLNLNVGIYSTTENPYLYLSNNGRGNSIIEKGYSNEEFYPAVVNFYTDYRISDKTMLRLQYDYQKTNFYINNYIGLSFFINFWNEKR